MQQDINQNKSATILQKHTYFNNKFFARWARLYDYEKYILFALRKKATDFFHLKPSQKILDVACGTGAQAYELAKRGHDVVGIDLSPAMLEQAKKKITPSLKLQFQHIDATDIPFKDSSFDASSISLGLHDMPYEIDLMVLSEIKRVTKPNGEILIVDYMEPRNHVVSRMIYPIIRFYETSNYPPFVRKGLKSILKQAGLTILRSTNYLGIFQIDIIKNTKK